METPLPGSITVTCDHCEKEYLLCPAGVAGLKKGSIKNKFCSEECWGTHTDEQNMLNAVNTTAPAN